MEFGYMERVRLHGIRLHGIRLRGIWLHGHGDCCRAL